MVSVTVLMVLATMIRATGSSFQSGLPTVHRPVMGLTEAVSVVFVLSCNLANKHKDILLNLSLLASIPISKPSRRCSQWMDLMQDPTISKALVGTPHLGDSTRMIERNDLHSLNSVFLPLSHFADSPLRRLRPRIPRSSRFSIVSYSWNPTSPSHRCKPLPERS